MANDYDAPDRIPEGLASSTEGLTSYEIDSLKNATWIQHGEPGHKGQRCSQCAYEGIDPHPIYTPEQMIDTHQNNLLTWNENCDKMVQDHLIYCPGGQSLAKCDLGHYPMPVKPTVPRERIR